MKKGGPNKSYLDTIGDVEIHQLDEQGRTTEKWTLNRAYAAEVDFGSLDYSSNDPVEITVKLGYKSFRVDFGMAEFNIPPIGKELKYDYFRNANGAKGAGPDNETPAACAKRAGEAYDNNKGEAFRITYKKKADYVNAICPAAKK